jgi:lysine-specific demethylase 3
MQDDSHHGSTKLHMDLTDAQNIMLFAAPFSDDEPGHALWHLFRPEDASIIREFARVELGFQGPDDAIHSQMIYLKPAMLDILREKYKITPYIIEQYPLESVCIPVGCAHQV